jgi:hypothetical protein
VLLRPGHCVPRTCLQVGGPKACDQSYNLDPISLSLVLLIIIIVLITVQNSIEPNNVGFRVVSKTAHASISYYSSSFRTPPQRYFVIGGVISVHLFPCFDVQDTVEQARGLCHLREFARTRKTWRDNE